MKGERVSQDKLPSRLGTAGGRTCVERGVYYSDHPSVIELVYSSERASAICLISDSVLTLLQMCLTTTQLVSRVSQSVSWFHTLRFSE